MKRPDEAGIVEYWTGIAGPWADAVQRRAIESRRLVTDDAILKAIIEYEPESTIDLGCGEGWLCRELVHRGIRATGVDAIQELISRAKEAGPGNYFVMPYRDVAAGKLGVTADLVVCNFSLLGNESTQALLGAIPSLLNPNGTLVIQTLHPVMASTDLPYVDGWRTSSWIGVIDEIERPNPWYFRTSESWIRLLVSTGFRLREVREPIHPKTQRPASLILIAGARPSAADR